MVDLIGTLEDRIAELEEEVRAARGTIASQNAELEELRGELRTLQTEVAARGKTNRAATQLSKLR